MVRSSAGRPSCPPPVPAESTTTRSATAAARSLSRRITSAMGERQMLPEQRTQMRYGALSMAPLNRALVGPFVAGQTGGEGPTCSADGQPGCGLGPEALAVVGA